MKKRLRLLGHIALDDDAILIAKPFSKDTIPYQRVTSISSSLTGLKIETGAQVHTANLWSPGAAREVAEGIRSRMISA